LKEEQRSKYSGRTESTSEYLHRPWYLNNRPFIRLNGLGVCGI
jgi:hypothetical protein